MRRKLGWGLGMVGALALTMSAVRADDVASLRAEMADMQTKMASMEAALATPAAKVSGDCEGLTSMRKRGVITIGGYAATMLQVVRRDDDPTDMISATQYRGENDIIDSTTFTGEANLYVDVQAAENAKLRLKLDLEDFFDGAVQNQDLLEEVYFQFKNVFCAPLTVNIGKKEVEAFGLDRSVGYLHPFTHGYSELFNWSEGFGGGSNWHTNVGTHGLLGTGSLPGEVDNTFMLEGAYEFQNCAKLILSVFQNPDSQFKQMHEDRSTDSLFFQSYAAKFELTPVEGLKLQASYINLYNDAAGDQEVSIYGNRAEDSKNAISLGLEYSFCGLPLEIFAEYLHGWDWGYRNGRSTDTASVGVIYGLTENIDLGVQFEWAGIDTDSPDAVVNYYENEDYYNLYLTAYYNMSCGMRLGVEYQHNWFEGNRSNQPAGSPNDVNADADYIGLVTELSF